MARRAHTVFAYSALFALALVSGCASTDRHHQGDEGVWFVHATTPHLFLDTSKDTDPTKKSAREKQEKLDQNALSDLWKQTPSLPYGDRPLSFLVLTGDFGVEPCSIADIPAPANSQDKPKAKD